MEQIQHRRKTGLVRLDFVDALMKGFNQYEKDIGGTFSDTDDLETTILASGFTLLIEASTLSGGTSALVWYLAKNQDVQETLYQEIRDAVEANNGEERLSYETIQNMPLLEGC